MGGFNSTLADPSAAAVVHVERQTPCPWGNKGISAPSEPPMGVPLDLWKELVQELDPLARRLNRGFLTTMILYAVAIIVIVIVSQSFSLAGYFLMVLVGVAVPTFCYVIWMYEFNNRTVDNQIRQVIAKLEPRFKGAGYEMRYMTQYTGCCKPKHAQSERIIAFYLTGIQTAAAGNSNNNSQMGNAGKSNNKSQMGNPDIDVELASGTTGTSLLDQLKQDAPTESSPNAELATGTTGMSLTDQLKQDGDLKGKY